MEAEVGVMPLQEGSRESRNVGRQSLETRKSRERILPQSLQEEHRLADTLTRPLRPTLRSLTLTTVIIKRVFL